MSNPVEIAQIQHGEKSHAFVMRIFNAFTLSEFLKGGWGYNQTPGAEQMNAIGEYFKMRCKRAIDDSFECLLCKEDHPLIDFGYLCIAVLQDYADLGDDDFIGIFHVVCLDCSEHTTIRDIYPKLFDFVILEFEQHLQLKSQPGEVVGTTATGSIEVLPIKE